MIRVIYSNDTGELLAELAQRVREQQLRDGPLKPVRIVVPSPSVESYVRIGVASACGIAANLQVSDLATFGVDLLQEATEADVAGAAALQALALSIFLDDAALAADDLAPVRAYLYACGDAPEALDVRRAQLAIHVGRLFETYSLARPDTLTAWLAHSNLDAAAAETERWQRALWRAMFGAGGKADECTSMAGRRLVPFHVLAHSLDVDAPGIPPAIHLFALSGFPRSFYLLLERLASRIEVVVYSLSPCAGFWEDSDARDPAPLHLWCRPGREHVRVLNALAGFDHDDRFVEPSERRTDTCSLLRALQSDILHRRSPVAGSGRADDSLVVMEHASVRRELEVVASDIWRLIAKDQSLRFEDIAVVVPDADFSTYALEARAVFRESHELPHHVLGSLVAPGSVTEAIGLLLALPYGRFTRQELLRIASHPLIAPTQASDPDRWSAWCEELGIVHGADRDDHAGTYVTRDILTWDQGLRRLALGAFMAGDASDVREPFVLGDEAYVPLEVAPSELQDAVGFGLLLRSLIEDARFARRAELSLSEWSRFLRAMVESYVVPANASDEEELSRALRRLYRLGELDIAELGGERGLGVRPVRYRLVAELARASLSGLRGAARGEGVVVATLGDLRPLSFRVVFTCGLGEGRFPSPTPEDALDLRWAHRRRGDVSQRERDQYAFLELLVTTRDRLVLSYVARDCLTGQTLASSSVVQELLHALSLGYVENVDALRQKHPLRRWDPAYFPDLFPEPRQQGPAVPPLRQPDGRTLDTLRLPEARAEARTLALRMSLESQGEEITAEDILLNAARQPGREGDRPTAPTANRWSTLAAHLMLTPLAQGAADARGRLSIPLFAIVKFLEFPLQAWARFRLGLDEKEDDDAATREHEIFETDFRDETLFLRQVFLEARAPGRTLADAYDQASSERELRGAGPSGTFARAERDGHLRILEAWRAKLAEHGVPIDRIEVHRFGRGGDASTVDRSHDTLVLDADYVDRQGVTHVVQVELAGRTLPLAPQASISLTLGKRGPANDAWGRVDRAQLRAFVDHAVLSATGIAAGQAHESLSILAAADTDQTCHHVQFESLSRDEACGWLRQMVRDLLSGPHDYFLPCEAVLQRGSTDEAALATSLAEAWRRVRASDGPPPLRSVYGPVPHPADYAPPSADEARAMIERRFGLFFAKKRRVP